MFVTNKKSFVCSYEHFFMVKSPRRRKIMKKIIQDINYLDVIKKYDGSVVQHSHHTLGVTIIHEGGKNE